jgi:hypothetical protein
MGALPAERLVRSGPETRIELNRALEMFLGELLHADTVQPQSEHPMISWNVRRKLVRLFFVRGCFLEPAKGPFGASQKITC